MEAQCPHCGTIYDVVKDDCGQLVMCESCGKKFAVEFKHSHVAKSSLTKSRQFRIGKICGNSDGDVHFIAPSLCCALLYIGNILAVLVGMIGGVGNAYVEIKNLEPLRAVFVLGVWFIATVFGLVIIRMWYELTVAIFEIVRHLRQIRDRKDGGK